jgi:16S rRNA (guanine966-N2)-methyltransferase
MKNKTPGRPHPGAVRIIAGNWRGRKVRLAADASMRPTPDRVRETLFNWLMPYISGARCLDLFAGSGVLGLEALSRGASDVCFVEQSTPAARQIEATLLELDCLDAQVLNTDALRYLQNSAREFDLVMLDPPFGSMDLGNLCTLLAQGWLAPGAHIYLEQSRRDALPELPANWDLTHEKTAGQVRFALARVRN